MATTKDDGFSFPNLEGKLNEPDPKIQSDPSDAISDTDKPAYSKKTSSKDKFSKLEASKITTDQISAEIEKAFDIKPKSTDPVLISDIINSNRRKALYVTNISQTIAEDKVVFKAWGVKLKSILPPSIYGDVDLHGAATVAAQNQQIITILDRQRRVAIDQAIRLRTQDIIKNRLFVAAHQDNITILSSIASSTRNIHTFLDTYVKKYMKANLELKFKHIFVSQDILKHTKLMIETLATKLESVKHNTSLSEIAKTSIIGEFKRNLRIKASNIVSDAILSPIKEPLNKFFTNITDKFVNKVGQQYQRYTGESPIEFDEEENDTISSKTRRASRKIRGDIGYSDRSFNDANMRQISDKSNQTLLSKSIESALSVLKSKDDETSAIKTLSKTSKDAAVFDQLTRRSIVDIIPSLLSKIHQQTSISNKILSFTARRSMHPSDNALFDKSIATEELKFDKMSENFVNKSDLDENITEGLFGNKQQRTNIVQPLISKLYKGYVKHGGEADTFKSALPDIVSFITNISKHAKVVKINHIKKYLDGGDLSEFEQQYLDAIFVDIPKESRKQLAEILSKTFFKDDTLNTIDTDVSNDIGVQVRDLIKHRASEIKKMSEVAQSGDLRDVNFVGDDGSVKHDKLRKIYSDVDTDQISENLEYSEEEQSSIKDEIKDRIKRAKEYGAKTVSMRGIRRKKGPPPVPPTRDDVQVSGPGEYVQGSKREFHIPFDKISEKVRATIEQVIGKNKIKDTTGGEKVKAKATDESIFEKMDGRLEQISMINEASLNALNNIIGKMDDENAPPKFSSRLWGAGKTSVKYGIKGVKAYLKGVGKFYGGIFKLGKKVGGGLAGAAPSILKGLGSAGKFGITKALPFLIKSYMAPYMFAGKMALKGAKGVFNLGKKLFTENKFIDVYRKDEVKAGNPLLKADDIKDGKYRLASGKVLKDSFSISEPIIDENNNTIISQDDIDHGLVDVKNKPLKRKGSIALRTLKFGAKGIGMILKGSFEAYKFILTKMFSVIPGIAGLFRRRKKGEGELVTSVNVEELITKHLITITELLKPISAQFGPVREGSYADYKRDREAEGSKKSRFNVRNRDRQANAATAAGKSKTAKSVGILSGIASLFGLGGDSEGGGGSTLGTLGTLAAGGYGLKKVKDWGGRIFGKKVATETAENIAKGGAKAAAKSAATSAAKSAAKKGMFKTALSKFGGTKGKILMTILGATGASMMDGGDEAVDAATTATKASNAATTAVKVGTKADKPGILSSIAKEMGISLAADKAIDAGKKVFGKKATEGVARQGILRPAMSTLGRFGFMQAARTAVISGATAVAGAVSSPVVLGGLAIAGLGAGGYALWKWSSGKDRRKSITKIRNLAYKVPEDKLSVLVDFENDVYKASLHQDDSTKLNEKIKEYIKKFDLDPDDQRQFTFFKHWYAAIFFPVLKGSIDIIEQSFKIDFDEQDKLSDAQLNSYKASLEGSQIYQELIKSDLELSDSGFTKWEKMNFFKDGETLSTSDIQKNLDKRLEETAKAIGDNKSLSNLKFNEMQEKAQERQDNIFDTYGDAGFIPSFNLPTKSPKANSIPPSKDEKSLEEYQRSYVGPDDTIIKDSKGKVSGTKTWAKLEPIIIAQLMKLGWSREAAIGVAANLYYESGGGNHNASGDKGTAHGLAQWRGDRQTLFAKKFGKDIHQSTPQEQIAFVDYELRHGSKLERKAGEVLMTTKSPSDAAAAFTRWYERPSDVKGDSAKRSALAMSIAKKYEGKSDEDIAKVVGATPPDTGKEMDEKTANAVDPELSLHKKIASSAAGNNSSSSGSSSSAFDGYGMPGGSVSDVGAGSPPTSTPSSGSKKGFFSSLNPFSKSESSETVSAVSGGPSDPSDFDTEADLGDSVAKYESGKKGVETISSGKGDPGGASYGKYQLASKTGTLSRYLKRSGYDKQFAGLAPGSAAFNAKWTELAKSDKNFADTQHEFIKATHFDPAIKKAAAAGFDVNNRGIQEAIWSGSIQHGGIEKIIAATAKKPGFDKMSPQEQIAAFYQQRGDYASFHMRKNGASESMIQSASYGRYKDEIKDVLKIANASSDNVKKGEGGLPAASPASQQPIENPTMADIQSKDIKAGLPKSNDVGGDVPKPVSFSPSQSPDSTKPIINTPSSPAPSAPAPVVSDTPAAPAPLSDADRIKKQTEQSFNNSMDEISSGKRAFKEQLRADKIKAGIPSDVAAREAREEADKKFNKPDYINKFSSGNLSPTVGVPAQTVTAQPTQVIKQETPPAAGPQEITVNDPEAKTQTSLLEQQNQLLSRIAEILNNGKPAETKTDGKGSDAIVSKLDEVINALTIPSTITPQSTPPPSTQTRTIKPNNSPGIDVTRQKVS